MNEEREIKECTAKFKKLTEPNQRYVVAIQQALIFAQDVEKKTKKKQCDRIY